MSFIFNNKEYEYFDHPSNQTQVNERRVELPISFYFIDQFKENEILEIGNVLGHYNKKYREHDVVDLYEKVPWKEIKNESILDFIPSKKYKALISISTLEHTENPLLAINRSLNMAENVLITIPVGYGNGWVKNIVLPNNVKDYYLKRISDDNRWEQSDKMNVVNLNYDSPFKFANGIVIIKK